MTNNSGGNIMKTMTKKERRTNQLNAHYKALEALARVTGDPLADWNGKKLSVSLLKLEQEAHSKAEDYCNGLINSEEWDAVQDAISERVKKLFGGDLPLGFFVNGDPRGCALKLNNETDEQMELILDCGLQRDWGGYGLLAPMIDGN
jgi:hypothetical protein